jgi:hypothetical protein
MNSTFPLTKNFKSNTYFNAFILNALVTALIAAFAIELRIQLNNKNNYIYDFIKYLNYSEDLHDLQSFFIEFFVTFIVAFLVYQLMYFIFEFGEGMTANNEKNTYF